MEVAQRKQPPLGPRELRRVVQALGSLIAIAQFPEAVHMPSRYVNLSDWIKEEQNVLIEFLEEYF